MNVVPFLCCLLLSLPLAGQSLLRQLADEVCDCMAASEIIYPRLQAGRCIEDVATAHPQRIQDELRLSVFLAADRRRLGELLVDPLAEHCTALQALGLDTSSRSSPELRYSDFSLARAATAPAVDKWPPPDASAATLRDAPAYRQTTGELLEIDRGVMHLLLDSGRVLTLRYQSRQLRRSPPRTGQRLEVTYAENWTANDRRVTYDLLEMR